MADQPETIDLPLPWDIGIELSYDEFFDALKHGYTSRDNSWGAGIWFFLADHTALFMEYPDWDGNQNCWRLNPGG